MMDEEKELLKEISSDPYDASDKPFDFIEEGIETALVCEYDSSIRVKIVDDLKKEGYYITEASSAREALKSMRFHVYQLIVVNEVYETSDPGSNVVIESLNRLPISIRRNIFVVLISSMFRTLDNMAAFNRSVNIIINEENIDDFGAVVKCGLAENEAFYQVFRETLRNTGRI